MEKKVVCFWTTGEWVTQFARDRWYRENASYEDVEEFLLDCMAGTDTPLDVLKGYAKDILEGRRKLAGHTPKYPGDPTADYHMEDDSAEEFYGGVEREIKRRADRKMRERAALAREEQETIYAKNLVDDYLENRRSENIHGASYGWLEPSGVFHEVDFAEHQNFARDRLIDEKGGRYTALTLDEMQRPGDALTARGWVLLHNPAMGIARVTRDESKRLTKAQREFLFDYYQSRGLIHTAMEFLDE